MLFSALNYAFFITPHESSVRVFVFVACKYRRPAMQQGNLVIKLKDLSKHTNCLQTIY